MNWKLKKHEFRFPRGNEIIYSVENRNKIETRIPWDITWRIKKAHGNNGIFLFTKYGVDAMIIFVAMSNLPEYIRSQLFDEDPVISMNIFGGYHK